MIIEYLIHELDMLVPCTHFSQNEQLFFLLKKAKHYKPSVVGTD